MCKTDDGIWALISEKNGIKKIHRLTFSRSLAELIQKLSRQEYQLWRLRYKVGKRLGAGEKSESGLYAIQSAKKDIALRITLFREAAEMFEDESRFIHEAWITGGQKMDRE